VYTRLTFDGGGIIAVNDSSPRVFLCGFIHGAFVFTDQNSADVEHNIFSGTGGPSLSTGYNTAIGLASTHSTVIGNAVIGYDTGIDVFDSLGSADIRDNFLLRNGIGIHVAGPALPATIKHNAVLASRKDGIVIGDGTTSEVTANTTLLNGGDGIRVDPSRLFTGAPTFGITAKLSRNVSMANVGWGIEAPPASASIAVTDGGGNFAHFNRAGQCRNFPCR
jgi:hypothetical protein